MEGVDASKNDSEHTTEVGGLRRYDAMSFDLDQQDQDSRPALMTTYNRGDRDATTQVSVED